MKQKINVIFLAAILLLAACKPELAPPQDFTGNPEDMGLVVELMRLTLDKTELATIGGNNLKLTVTKTPDFATRSNVKWTSSNEEAATVAADGDGTIYTNAAVTESALTIIRVESITDSSVYAECPVTVYPDYGSNRYWNFGSSGWYASTEDDPAGQQIKFGAIVFTADSSLGNGMTLKGQTGNGTYENPTEAPNGLPLEGGQIPATGVDASQYPPYPWVYEIDPDNPYIAGLTPANSTRNGMSWNDSNPTNIGFRAGNLITNGAGRIFSIAALKGPFYIEVRYTTNSDNTARWADIRIGDTSGLRIQGSPSDHRTNASGRGIASYTYTNDDIVPFVYIEAQASIRIYEVIIKAEETDIPDYRPVTGVAISGNGSVKNGGTITLNSSVTPTDATNPEYSWTIEGAGASIEGSATGTQVVVRGAADSGTVTVKLTVRTEGYGGGVTAEITANKEITLEAAGGGGTTDTWTFATVVPQGWTNDGSTNNNTDADYGNNMTLTASIRTTRINTNQNGPGGLKGCIQPNGAGNFAKITGLPGSFTVTVKYANTSNNADTTRVVTATVGSTTSPDGEGAVANNAAAPSTLTWDYSGAAGDLILAAKGGGVRVYEITVTY